MATRYFTKQVFADRPDTSIEMDVGEGWLPTRGAPAFVKNFGGQAERISERSIKLRQQFRSKWVRASFSN